MHISNEQRNVLASLIPKLEECTGSTVFTRENLLTVVALIGILDSQRDLLVRQSYPSGGRNWTRVKELEVQLELLSGSARRLLQSVLEQSASGSDTTTSPMPL